MKNILLFERSLFASAIFLSASIHVGLIGLSGWLPSGPQAAVVDAPSSLEITVIHRPIVTVIEEEIVSEEIIEEVVLGEMALEGRDLNPGSRKSPLSSAASQEFRGAITKAKPTQRLNPAPPYPWVARRRGWEGIVRLNVFVEKDGTPTQVDVLESSGHEILDKAALRTVKEWKFSPAQSGHIRFSSRITLPIQFTLIKE